MYKKLSILLCVFIMQAAMIGNATAETASKEDSGGYLKIFTPYHRVKSVSLPSKVENETIEAFAAKPSKNSSIKAQLTEEEIDLVAKIVYAESKGEPFIGKIGVASVILNRLSHPHFPKSIREIIFQKNAFSCIDDGYQHIEPDEETYEAIDEAMRGYDPTDSAVFFYNPKTATCQWIKKVSKIQTIQIGNHVFFR